MACVSRDKQPSPRSIQFRASRGLPYLRIEGRPNLLVSFISTFPATLFLVLAITAIALVTRAIGHAHFQNMLDALGFDLAALKHGRFYVLPLGPLIQDRPGLHWKVVLLIIVVACFVGPLEYLARPWRAAATYFLTDSVSTIGSTLLLWGLAALGSTRAHDYIHTPDLGSSSAAFGCAAAFAAMLPGRWRLAVTGGLAAYLLPSLIVVRHVFAVEHAIAALTGFALGLLWRRAASRQTEQRGAEGAP